MPESLSQVRSTCPNTSKMHKHTRLLLVAFLWITCQIVRAGDSRALIKGKAADYAGDTLTFLAYSNMISFSEEVLGHCAVDDSGYFECLVPLEGTRHIFTYLGIYNCYLYARPGISYKIHLPRKREKTMQDLVNPYFQETSIHLAVRTDSLNAEEPGSGQEDNLNFMIRAFNDSFYPYYYKYVVDAYGNRVNKQELEAAEKEIRSPFDSVQDPYLEAYIDYRIGLLEHYGNQVSNARIIRNYFLGKPVLYANPAYMELFNEVFKNYFIAFAEENPDQKLPRVLNHEMDYAGAERILATRGGFKNDSLRELIMVKGLYDGYYDGKNIPSSMIQLLDSMQHKSPIEIYRTAVRDIMLRITSLLPGYQPPDFALYRSDSALIRLSDFRGKYVYLNFCNSFGYYCVREYEYLRVLQKRLGDRLSIVTILVDDSFENMEKLVTDNEYPWIFLHFSNQPQVLKEYDIRAYPSYFLIGPEGKLILSPAPSPAENFESTFLRISSGM